MLDGWCRYTAAKEIDPRLEVPAVELGDQDPAATPELPGRLDARREVPCGGTRRRRERPRARRLHHGAHAAARCDAEMILCLAARKNHRCGSC